MADNLDDQLTTNAKAFFANTENFRYDAGRQQFYLSSILSWFGEDFGNSQAAQLKRVAPYLPSKSAHDAALKNAVRVSYLDYDWNLNEQKPTRR